MIDLRPRKRNLVSAAEARKPTTIAKITAEKTTITLLRRFDRKSVWVSAITKLSKFSRLGRNLGTGVSTSSRGLNAVFSIQYIGNSQTTTNSAARVVASQGRRIRRRRGTAVALTGLPPLG